MRLLEFSELSFNVPGRVGDSMVDLKGRLEAVQQFLRAPEEIQQPQRSSFFRFSST